jgi:hypothetical protein
LVLGVLVVVAFVLGGRREGALEVVSNVVLLVVLAALIIVSIAGLRGRRSA